MKSLRTQPVRTPNLDGQERATPQLEADERLPIVDNDEIINFPKVENGGVTKLSNEYPIIRRGENSKVKVVLSNHKISSDCHKVASEFELSLVLEVVQASQDGHWFLSIIDLQDKPLIRFDCDPTFDPKAFTFGAGYLTREKNRTPVLTGVNDKKFYLLNNPADYKDSLLNARTLAESEDSSEFTRDISSSTFLTTTPFVSPDTITDVVVNGKQLCIVNYNKNKRTEVKVAELALGDNNQVSHHGFSVLQDRTILAILTSGGNLVVKDTTVGEPYLHVGLPSGTVYRHFYFSKETSSLFVLAATSTGGSTKVTIFEVTCEKAKAPGNPTQVIECSIPQSKSDGIKLGVFHKDGQKSFLLIFNSGAMYNVIKGEVNPDQVITSSKDAVVSDIKSSLASKKPEVFLILKPAGDKKVGVNTVAKVQIS